MLRSRSSPDEFLAEREGAKRREMMDSQIWKQRREEMVREAEQDRFAKTL